MDKKVWKISLVIAGFFTVMVAAYYLSQIDISPTGPSPANESGTHSDLEAGENDDGSATAERADRADEAQDSSLEILLQPGDTGKTVQQLQKQLNALGYDLDVDGQYGIVTQWYVKDVQQQGGLSGNGTYTAETEKLLSEALDGKTAIEAGQAIHLVLPERTVTNPDDVLAVVNKHRRLPADYEPQDLVQPDVPQYFQGEDLPYNKVRLDAAEALERLFERAEQEGLQLVARSGYRSYATQVEVFARNEQKHGEEKANKYSARPGESEHQTGLAMDVTGPAVGHELVTEFEETEEGKWLERHAAEFGFIIRYPEGKEEMTGYQYEPWHLRYVGNEAAAIIMSENLTLEEYVLSQ